MEGIFIYTKHLRVFNINCIVFHQYSNSLIDKMMQFKISQYKVKQQKKKPSSVFQMNFK